MSSHAKRIFSLYAKQDMDLVGRVRAAFQALGMTWVDSAQGVEGDGIPSDEWQEDFRRNIENSDVFLIFASPRALESPTVLFEIGLAYWQARDSSDVRLFPVLIEGTTEQDLPPFLRRFKAIDGHRCRTEDLADLIFYELYVAGADVPTRKAVSWRQERRSQTS